MYCIVLYFAAHHISALYCIIWWIPSQRTVVCCPLPWRTVTVGRRPRLSDISWHRLHAAACATCLQVYDDKHALRRTSPERAAIRTTSTEGSVQRKTILLQTRQSTPTSTPRERPNGCCADATPLRRRSTDGKRSCTSARLGAGCHPFPCGC